MIPSALDQADVRALAGHLEATVATIVAAFVVWRLSIVVIDRFFARRFVSRYVPRVATFCTLSKSLVGLIVFVVSALELLNIWAVNVAPAVWSAGFVTAALAFGSQSVVRDIVTGFFFLFEEQYDVGDEVELVTSTGQVLAGTVDAMGLRTTRIIDHQGRFVVAANGNISLVTNASRSPTKVSFFIAVPWRDDATAMRERILAYVRKIGEASGVPGDGLSVTLADSSLDGAVFRIDIRSENAQSRLDQLNLRERLVDRLQADGWIPRGAGVDKPGEIA